MIRYYLLDNPLTADPDDCRAQVLAEGSKSMEDVIDLAMKRGSLVTRPDMAAVVELLFDVMTDLIADGYLLHTPLCTVRPTIKGAFANDEAPFDKTLHEVVPSLIAGSLLKKKMLEVVPERITGRKPQPMPGKLFDQTSGAKNGEITPGGMALLKGEKLSWDLSDTVQGLFFIDSSGAATQVSAILEAGSTKISFQIPASLTQGSYSLQLRSKAQAQELRTGVLDGLEVK
ncbi:MAG: DUF4469 domain-containing protein [Bacteroidota bacterium]|nr:DUF4469 domain-containing protein [Bacteroidota bacterium]